jgi:trimethylamine:corrinoid methyltransferase-like protein
LSGCLLQTLKKTTTKGYYSMNSAIDKLYPLSNDELNQIHAATLDILENTAMCFESEEAREIFNKNGFKDNN